MLQINPKKFKPIKNKAIPNALRPKFRNKSQANIYFLSQRKYNVEKKTLFPKQYHYRSANTNDVLLGMKDLVNKVAETKGNLKN